MKKKLLFAVTNGRGAGNDLIKKKYNSLKDKSSPNLRK